MAVAQPQCPPDLPGGEGTPLAVLLHRGFLYRRILVRSPFAATLEYQAYGIRESIRVEETSGRFDFRVEAKGAPVKVGGTLDRIQAGVIYVNRRAGATTGAWPGVQPFGGWKGSGTTGKAGGGPYYVTQYMREQSRTVIEE